MTKSAGSDRRLLSARHLAVWESCSQSSAKNMWVYRIIMPYKDQAAQRANGRCERCGGAYKRPEFDHILPCALGGEPTLVNCMVLCEPCHKEKTADDIRRVRKADRQRRNHLGARKPSARPLRSAGFQKKPKPEKITPPDRRPIYE